MENPQYQRYWWNFSHGPRCHDLALFAEHGESIVTICVEAKADEPFDATVTDELRNAKKRPVTAFPQRLDWLTRTLFGLAAFNGEDHDTVSDQVRNLPYQLLTAGTLREAELRHSTKGNSRDSRISDAKDRRREDGAKCQPIESLSSASASAKRWADENFQLRCGQLIGPLPVPVEEVHQISLFVGNLEPTG